VRDLPGEADAFHEPAQVLWVGREVELDHRRDVQLGAGDRQSARARGRSSATGSPIASGVPSSATACGPPMPATRRG
jgi:hypothetical protein